MVFVDKYRQYEHFYSDCPMNEPLPELARVRSPWIALPCQVCLQRQWEERVVTPVG